MEDSKNLISRQAAIDAIDVLCQEHRYRIPGKRETYSQYNEAWQDALDRAENAIGNLPSTQPEIIRCKDCKWYGFYSCELHGNDWMRDGNGFCDRAERREE